MHTEPPDTGWFTPGGGHGESAGTPPTASPAGAEPHAQPGTYGQPYSQPEAYPTQTGSHPSQTGGYPAQAGGYPPQGGGYPAQGGGYAPAAGYPPATTYGQPYPQPPTGEYPAQRPPGGPIPARRHAAGGDGPARPAGTHPPAGRPAGSGSRAPSGGHSHSHGPGTGYVVSARTQAIVRWILIPCALATAAAIVLLWPGRPAAPEPVNEGIERAYGQVVQVVEEACAEGVPLPGPPMPCGTAAVRITEGEGTSQTVTVTLPQGTGAPHLSVGDDVVLGYVITPGTGEGSYEIIDKQRGRDMWIMVALCAIAIVAFGRLRGVTALIGLGVSFAILLLFIIPAILDGASPLLVAVVGSAAIMFAVLYLTHGFSVHTSVAVLGTLASLVLTGLLGALFIGTTSLTGGADETSLYLSFLDADVDLRGLLLAGIIIGALGVLDDVTVTQASTVAELARTGTSRLEIYRAAIRVGRAHVASAVNTLVLAYAGAALPLLLLIAAGGQNIGDLLTGQFFAEEIVRAVVGTIGLVAAVPITTALGVLVADLRGHNETASHARPRPHEGRRAPEHRPDPDHWAEAVTRR